MILHIVHCDILLTLSSQLISFTWPNAFQIKIYNISAAFFINLIVLFLYINDSSSIVSNLVYESDNLLFASSIKYVFAAGKNRYHNIIISILYCPVYSIIVSMTEIFFNLLFTLYFAQFSRLISKSPTTTITATMKRRRHHHAIYVTVILCVTSVFLFSKPFSKPSSRGNVITRRAEADDSAAKVNVMTNVYSR